MQGHGDQLITFSLITGILMLTAAEKKTIKKLLSLAPDKEQTFGFDELQGFLFGLAITPDIILPSDWMPIIFAGDMPEYTSLEQADEMTGCLVRVYNKMTTAFHDNKLDFPFNMDRLTKKQLISVYEWVSGFEEAMALREELWDPEEFPAMSERKKEELYHCMVTIQGLVDPTDVMDFFDNLPDEVLQEIFPEVNATDEQREMQIQAFLLATLPLTIETLQYHARSVEKKRQKKTVKKVIPAISSNRQAGAARGKEKTRQINGKPKENVIHVDFQQRRKESSSPAPVYQLKVSLQGAKPPIWRRIQVPGKTTLAQLHEIVQISMGWEDTHLHQFLIDRTCYCSAEEDDGLRTSRPKNEGKYTLHSLADKIQPSFNYIYDYGDDWIHQIKVEKILPVGEGKPYPLLITGRRACPPEDSGGIHGYMRLIDIMANPEDDEFEQTIEWLGPDFDPAYFGKQEISAINVLLKELYS